MTENNLTLQGYGIKLHRLTEDKIELVRCWRNNPKIQQYMDYREYITPEQQKSWFKRINNDKNYFFIVEIDGKDVGLVDIKDINDGFGESGIFLWDDAIYGKKVSYRALLLLHDFAFQNLGLKILLSHILRDNIRSQKCYTSLGFYLCDGEDNKKLQLYMLDKEIHFVNKQSVINKINNKFKFRKLD